MNMPHASERRFNQHTLTRREKIIGGLLAGAFGAAALSIGIDIIKGGDLHGEQLVRVGDDETTLYEAVNEHVDISGNCVIGKVIDSVANDERNHQVLENSEIMRSGLIYMPESCD